MNVYSCTVIQPTLNFHVEILADNVFDADSILLQYLSDNQIHYSCLYGCYFVREYVPDLFDSFSYINF